MAMVTQQEPKPLGLVWVSCSNSVVASGLQKVLEPYAHVHHGHDPPETSAPSSVICDPNEEDVASEVGRLRGLAPGTPVLVFGRSEDLSLARSSLRAGARGFLHAQMPPQQMVRALSVAAKGEVVLPRNLVKGLVEQEPPADLGELSIRQQEILELVSEGLSNAQIAKRLFLSESTVKQHLRRAYKTLGVRNRTKAARLLRDNS
jgi:DNA-binding NarL/FixJ family response regulator